MCETASGPYNDSGVIERRGRRANVTELRVVLLSAAMAVCSIAAACTQPMTSAAKSPSPARSQDDSRGRVIDHLSPARDSMGSAPTRFSWTAIEGADRYA